MNIGRIIGAGFRVIGERPIAVAIWLAIYVVIEVGSGLITLPLIHQQMANDAAGQTGGASQLAIMLPIWGLMIGKALIGLLVWAASYRAILRPEETAFGYVRLGMDELRLLGLSLIFTIFWMIVWIGLVLLLSAVGVGMAFSTHNNIAGVVLMLVAMLVLFVMMVFLAVRFALAFPLTFYRRKIIIGEAWTLSRGNFWAMFVSFLVVFVIYIVLAAIVSLIAGGSSMVAVMGSIGNAERMQGALAQLSEAQTGGLSIMMIIGWILGAGTVTLWVAMAGCGLGDAAAQVIPESYDDLAEIYE